MHILGGTCRKGEETGQARVETERPGRCAGSTHGRLDLANGIHGDPEKWLGIYRIGNNQQLLLTQEVRSQGRRAMQMSPGLLYLKQVPEGMNEFARESKRSVGCHWQHQEVTWRTFSLRNTHWPLFPPGNRQTYDLNKR